LGDVPPFGGTPDRYVTLDEDGAPQARIDLYAGRQRAETFVFEEAIAWGEWLVIGFGERVFLVRFPDRRTSTLELGSYFGRFYPFESCLLVASGERLFKLQTDGELAWSTGILGLDGVRLGQVIGNMIEGEGEWDPPGGWRPFRVDLRSGELLASTGHTHDG
jgi:hypothetical protein